MTDMPAQQAPEVDGACQLGFGSALLTCLGGLVYVAAILAAMLTGQFTFPPPEWLQLLGGVISLALCPLLVTLVSMVHAITPADRKVFSRVSLGFTLLFAMAVSINRFTQLGVVRQSLASGSTAGIEWFLPYDGGSVMFGMEMLGWGWFLGLAMLFAAPVFAGGRLQRWLRWLCVAYAVLALISAVAFLLDSPLSVIGFAAWGGVLFVISALLIPFFRRTARAG